jgi:hypothetical protein
MEVSDKYSIPDFPYLFVLNFQLMKMGEAFECFEKSIQVRGILELLRM